jgi:tetratricopeptide (TPR) repeat protein
MVRLRFGLGAVALCLSIGGQSWALDSVKTVKGVFSGHLAEMSPVKVDLQQGISGNTTKEVPVNQIITIFFENEPADLKAAKMHVVESRFSDALAELDRIKEGSPREQIKQDVEFYKALCSARLALGGSGQIADAGHMMIAFVDNNPKSYHYFEGVETVGDLLVAVGQYPRAAEYYARLGAAPWPDYTMRAGVAIGRALLAQGKNDEAMHAFEKVLATENGGELATAQRVMADLGKAAVLAAAKKNDEAVGIVENVLKKADAADEQVQARAYNVLGTAYRQAGRPQEALLAFLHVELLYSNIPDAHAEALANLADLWEQVHKAERAQRARRTLEERYKNSPWARKKRT